MNRLFCDSNVKTTWYKSVSLTELILRHPNAPVMQYSFSSTTWLVAWQVFFLQMYWQWWNSQEFGGNCTNTYYTVTVSSNYTKACSDVAISLSVEGRVTKQCLQITSTSEESKVTNLCSYSKATQSTSLLLEQPVYILSSLQTWDWSKRLALCSHSHLTAPPLWDSLKRPNHRVLVLPISYLAIHDQLAIT